MAIRRVLLLLAFACSVALIPAVADAHHKPGHHRGPTTTTPPATTASTTTTTIAATTTTGGGVPATTVTLAGEPPPEGPITISSGGTYSNRSFVSNDSAVAAVTINTTAAVTLDHVVIRHKGMGVRWLVSGTNVTVTNTKFIALGNGGDTSIDQRAVYLYHPASVVIEHNSLTDGHGILIQADSVAISPLRIRYNDAVNIARWGTTGLVQFVQFNTVASEAEIAWNRVFNTQGQSQVEDNINMYQSSGADAAHPINIHHNMIRGAYARTGDGSGYTGGGILAGDHGGNYTTIQNNRVTGTSNYGVTITGGHDNYHLNNRVVSDGKTEAGVPHGPSTATGVVIWNYLSEFPTGPNTNASGNVMGWTTPQDTRNDSWFPACDPAGACSSNTTMGGPITAQMELDEWDAWAVDLAAAGLTVGPNW